MAPWIASLFFGSWIGIFAAGQSPVERAAPGYSIQPITQAQITEAIRFGQTAKEVIPYRLFKKPTWSTIGIDIGTFATPYLRVALAAHEAKVKYKSFTEADAKGDLVADWITVVALPTTFATNIYNVQDVLILPASRHDPESVIHPLQTAPLDTEYKNLYGFKGEGRGLIASFPLASFLAGSEVHVIYDQQMGKNGCQDCSAVIKLDRVR